MYSSTTASSAGTCSSVNGGRLSKYDTVWSAPGEGMARAASFRDTDSLCSRRKQVSLNSAVFMWWRRKLDDVYRRTWYRICDSGLAGWAAVLALVWPSIVAAVRMGTVTITRARKCCNMAWLTTALSASMHRRLTLRMASGYDVNTVLSWSNVMPSWRSIADARARSSATTHDAGRCKSVSSGNGPMPVAATAADC